MSLFAAGVERRAAVPIEQTLREMGVVTRGAVGRPVTADSALRLSVWWGCVHLLSSVVSGLPVDVFRRGSDGVRQELDPRPTVVDAPSRLVSAMSWRYQLMVSAMQRGNAFGLVTARDRRGYPLGVELLHPDTVQVRQPHQLAEPEFWLDGQQLAPEDVFHMPAYSVPGSVVGLSPLRYARASLAAGLAAIDYGEQFWDGGGHPTAILSSEQVLNSDSAKEIKTRFKDATSADKLAVLGAGLSYQAVQVSPSDAGWLDSINATDLMICRFAGVPPEMLGIATSGSSVTYANREQRAIDFLTFTVQWWLTRIEEAWSALLPRGTYVKHNTGALLRTDTKTRAEVAAIRLQNGITNPDFERALDDLPPIPGGQGEQYLWPPSGATQTAPQEGSTDGTA